MQGRCCKGKPSRRLCFTSEQLWQPRDPLCSADWCGGVGGWGLARATWFALPGSSLLWPALPHCRMKNIIASQILKLKDQPEHLRPCYRDKWVSGKTDVTLHVPLPQPVRLLFNVSFVSLLSFVSARSCNSPRKDGINLGDLEHLVAACFFQGTCIQGLGRENWRINLSVPGLKVPFSEL